MRRTQQSDIAGELRDHLIEHVAELERRGVPHEQAVREALTEFGDAAALAASFSALVRTRRRRLIMRCTIGTTLVMAGLMIGVFAFRPPVENDPGLVQAQQGPGTIQKEDHGAALKAIRSEPSDPRDNITRERLSKGVDAEFTEIPLREVLQYLGDQLKIQFYIDRKSMGVEGIAEDVPVSFNLKDVPGEMILDLVLRELGLAYTIRSGVVMVASKSDIQSQTEVRVYPVTNGAEELAQLIPNTIEPHTWRYVSYYPMPVVEPYASQRKPNAIGGVGGVEEGGGVGSIRVFQGVLVVSQTPGVHQKIEKLINDLNSVLSRRPQAGKTLPSTSYLPPPFEPSFAAPPQQRVSEFLGGRKTEAPRADTGTGVPTTADPAASGLNRATTKELPETK